VHVLVSADVCVILSNVDGFYLKGNTKNEAPELLSTIPRITPEIERHAGGSNSHRSVGGMRSKLLAARRVLSSKKPLVIANGHIPDVLPRLCRGDELGTIFMP
jgi:glutamate 5-kinase